MRKLALVVVCSSSLCFVPSARGQISLFTIQGDAAGDQFGWAVSPVGDRNGDGVGDFAVGIRQFDLFNTNNVGAVRICSGSDGATIFQFPGNAASDRFGSALALLGDLNGDGFSDILVGAPQPPATNPFGQAISVGSGYAAICSGLDGSTLSSFPGTTLDERFGEVVAAAGDLNNDGVTDFLIAAPRAGYAGANAGRVFVHSGFDGTVLFQLDGLAAGDRFGSALGEAGDVDDDGYDDFMVGSPRADVGGMADAGQVLVFSGFNAAILLVLNGEAPGDQFGSSVAHLGDVNGDGHSDLAVGAPLHDPNGLLDAGKVTFFSGMDGSALDQVQGDLAGRTLGSTIQIAGDVNQDGNLDLIVAAPGGTAISLPYVTVVSTHNGQEIVRILADSPSVGFGASVCGFGSGKVLVGSPNSANGTVSGFNPVKPKRPEFHAESNPANGLPISGQPFLAEKLEVHEHFGTDAESENSVVGYAVAFIRDTNNDGRRDYLVGISGVNIPGHSAAGKLVAYSGISGAVMSSSKGTSTFMHWGMKVASAGDVDGDGLDDHMFSASKSAVPGSKGVVRVVLSGDPTPWVIDMVNDPQANSFGESIASAGDVNGDGYDDILVGAELYGTAMPQGTAPGRVYVYSGATRSLLYFVEGTQHFCRFGYAVAGVGDLDADGFDDFAVGAPYLLNPEGKSTGGVFVFSGQSGAQIYLWHGTKLLHGAGFSVGAAGDIDGDGTGDVLLGLPSGLNISSAKGMNPYLTGEIGSVQIRSGKTGAILGSIPGKTADDFFGWQVAGGHDFNSDGIPDIVVGAPSPSLAPGNGLAGSVTVFSGATLTKLVQIKGKPNDHMGLSLCVGDMEGDGKVEILVGGPNYFDLVQKGFVRIYRVVQNPDGGPFF